MDFHSILFAEAEADRQLQTAEMPDFFVDLNLDQIVDAITAGRQEYNLKPFFFAALHDVSAIEYRHEIMREMERKTVFESVDSFARKMRAMRARLAQADKLYYKYQKERWFLNGVEIYCDAVDCLTQDLASADVTARGFCTLREYLTRYVASARFTSLAQETQELMADLASVQYCLLISGNHIKVRKSEGEIDYSADIEETFRRFKQGEVKDYTVKIPDWPDMNHVEAQVLGMVARLNPEVFSALNDFCARNDNYVDHTIEVFEREIQFYTAYLEYVARFKRAGLEFCYPEVTARNKGVYDYGGFDLALAFKLMSEKSAVVCNDFYLLLASIGCPVPGREARLFLGDQIFTHFEREEDINNLSGKLQDDLVRIHDILSRATSASIIIINEIFSSTTLQDAIFLGKEIMARLIRLDVLGVCVTFIEELGSVSEKTVSMVSTVVPENPTLRTYKIVRRAADGLSYAIAIAEKHRVTYASLKERIKS